MALDMWRMHGTIAEPDVDQPQSEEVAVYVAIA
jgi:hypothetical protein